VLVLLTICVRAVDVLPLKFALPPYTAVSEWLPTLNAVVFRVATPLEFNVPGPSVTVPSLNVTVPLGVPDVEDFTVAVSVIDRWKLEGFFEEANVVVEPA
jgi:hypothetical protein